MMQLVPVHTQNVSTQRWTTMVVEDDATLRDLMRRILEKLDFEVLVAGDADEALALAKANRDGIDVVVTDVVMPGMDGFELAAKLTAIHPTARILFLTGYAEDSPTVRDGLGLGNAFPGKTVLSGRLGRPGVRATRGPGAPPRQGQLIPGLYHSSTRGYQAASTATVGPNARSTDAKSCRCVNGLKRQSEPDNRSALRKLGS